MNEPLFQKKKLKNKFSKYISIEMFPVLNTKAGTDALCRSLVPKVCPVRAIARALSLLYLMGV